LDERKIHTNLHDVFALIFILKFSILYYRVKKFILFILDAAVLYASLLLVLKIRYPDHFADQHQSHFYPFLLIFGLWLLIFYIANLYETRLLRNNVHFYTALFRAIAFATTISVLFFYLIPLFGITPKTNLILFTAIVSGLAFATRWLFNGIVENRFKKSVLIVGTDEQSQELARFIRDNPQWGYVVNRTVDPTDIESIERIIREEQINIIVLNPGAYQMARIIDLFYKSLNKKIGFVNLSSFYERLTGQVPLGTINQIWFLENLNEGNKRAYEIFKRGADFVSAVVIGIIALILFPFIMISIRATSAGPVFYRQRRVGQAGRAFNMIKFRTMRQDAEQATGAVWAAENDPRITRVGRFLRKTRLDELPQIWNIFKGEMSFIGPRAERPEFHEQLKAVPFYEERYLIKPGLTGWAQINFRYGSSVKDAAEKLKYDLYYIKNRSPILDLGIFLKTARIILQQSGK